MEHNRLASRTAAYGRSRRRHRSRIRLDSALDASGEGVTSVKCLARAQPIFERYEVRPTLVLDYPVSSRPEGYELIRDLHRSGGCEIGAHLQPWDNPPFVEQRTDENSYPGNLPSDLERKKLIRLTQSIHENLGLRPRIYKAGRYGVGRATAGILAELGYEIDVSEVPRTDLCPDFGPDFSHCSARPYWFGEDHKLLEIPLSIGYTGLLAQTGAIAYELTMNERLKALHVPGILARLGLVDRITLTPEGISFDEQRRLTRAAARGSSRLQLHLSQHVARARQYPLCAERGGPARALAPDRAVSRFFHQGAWRPGSDAVRSQGVRRTIDPAST